MSRPRTGDNRALSARAQAAAAAWEDAALLPTLRAAAAAAPDDPERWQLLGLAQRNLDEHGDALASFRQAIRLAPDDALLAHALARTALEAGLPAVALFERTLKLAPLDASVMLGLAAAQLAAGDPSAAIAGLRRQLRRYPDWYDGHASLARLSWQAGHRDTVGASFEEALRSRPRDGLLWREYAMTMLGTGAPDHTRAVVARARAALGRSRVLDLIEAASSSEAGDLAAADALFASGPTVDDAFLAHYVRHLLRAGRADRAAELLEGRLDGEGGRELLPLAALAWRAVGDPRWRPLADARAVRVFDLEDRLPDLAALADRLRALHRTAHHPLDQSPRGGTQTDGPLFARLDPELRALRSLILDTVRTYLNALAAPPDATAANKPIRFAGSWSVRLTGGGHHVDHVHPAGWISSAFYVVVPDGAERDPDRSGWLTLGDAPSLDQTFAPIAEVAPRPGRLVLFPSTMWHRTRPFSAGERLSVAFDIARPPR